MAKESNKKVVPVDFDAITKLAPKSKKEFNKKINTRKMKSQGILRTKK